MRDDLSADVAKHFSKFKPGTAKSTMLDYEISTPHSERVGANQRHISPRSKPTSSGASRKCTRHPAERLRNFSRPAASCSRKRVRGWLQEDHRRRSKLNRVSKEQDIKHKEQACHLEEIRSPCCHLTQSGSSVDPSE